MNAPSLLWCALFAAFTTTAASAGSASYVARDLGYGQAYAINESRVVVGGAGTNSTQRAFRWENGVMTDLGTLGGVRSTATAVNDAGVVVGRSDTVSGVFHAFRHDGTMTDLDPLSTITFSIAHRINNAGAIVGARDDHAYSYQNGMFTSLGATGNTYSSAIGINNAGTIVGSVLVTPSPRAFRYDAGVMTDLGWIGPGSVAFAINDAGQITGHYYDTGRTQTMGFVLTGETVVLFGMPGSPFITPHDINSAGAVVGINFNTSTSHHAFIYEHPIMTDLAPLLVPIGIVRNSKALGINDRGDIVGSGENAAGYERAFLLLKVAPCPKLSLQRKGPFISLHWPANATNAVLEVSEP